MKKIAAIITTLVMLTASVCGPAMAAFTDVADTNPYKKAITTLSLLKVIDGYDDQTFKPDGAITRAEFTKLIVFMLGHQNLTYNSGEFTDVDMSPTGHWARNYIQTAYNLGIISGMGDGTFAPESTITYEQALKMIVCTLGYDHFAQAQPVTNPDDWAEKYIKQANSLGLTKNISGVDYRTGVSRGVVAQALYNALEINMYEFNSYQWVQTNKTLLNDYLQVKELKGTLVGVEDTITEDCKSELLESEMCIRDNAGVEYVINFSNFTQNKTDIIKFLGNTITVFYNQPTENDERMLVIIDDQTSKNTSVELDQDDLSSFSEDAFKYYDSTSHVKTAKLRDTDLTVRYNGKLVSATDEIRLVNPSTGEEEVFSRMEALKQWLNPNTDYTIYGSVTITDNSNDGIIDMLQIYNYETMVALATPSTSDYRVTDKLVTGNYLPLDPQAANYEFTITKNGAQVPVTSISANDVILYAKSLDESLVTLLVSNTTVKGSVSSINSQANSMNINGNSYKIGKKCVSYIKDKDGKELKAGVSGTFYIDAFGTAVFGTLEQASIAPYAYILDAFVDYDEGGKPYVTVYSTTSNNVNYYQLKDKVKFNGSTISANAAISRLAETSGFSNKDAQPALADKIYGAGKTPDITSCSQPARVMIKNNLVTEIATMTSDASETQNDDKEKIVICKELDKYTYSSNGFTLAGKTAFSVNSSTIVLCVPADRDDEKKYAKKTPASAFTSGDSYYVEAYDISSSKIAGLVILYGNDGSLTPVKKDTDFSVVAKLPEDIYDENKDETVLSLNVFAGASNVLRPWATFDKYEFADVSVGDVIQFAYDSENYAQGLISNIKFSDIASVLDGDVTNNDQLYNWEEELTPSEENNFQSYKFDYRFKRSGSDDEIYTSSTVGTVPYSQACMYNVSQVLLEENKLYVTKGGFDETDDGYVLDDSNYEEISVLSSTKIVRMEDDREEISKFAPDTTTDMTISDLRDAKNYGKDCSKILVCSSKGVARLIVVYN